MYEWMFGGLCAGVVCEDMLLCTSVLRSSNCTPDGVSGKMCMSTWRSLLLGHLSCGTVPYCLTSCSDLL